MASKFKIAKEGDEARNKIMEGVNFYANKIKRTAGPYGKNAIIGIRGGDPQVTNDGDRIGRELMSKDELVDLGIRAIRGGVKRTNEEVNDFSTTTTVLIQAMSEAIIDMMPGGEVMAKMSMIQLKKKLDDEVEAITSFIEKTAIPVTSREQLIKVTLASVEDETLAEMIGGTQYDIGPEGSIIAEEVA